MNLSSQLLMILVFVALAESSRADRILDQSYYLDHTYNRLTFNVDGSGSEINLSEGGIVLIPEGEYSAQGVSRIYTGYWGRDASDEFQELLEKVATAPISCAIADQFDFDPSVFEFTPAIRSFGTWVFHNISLKRPTFNAFDVNGKLIETVLFDKDAVDGKSPGGGIEYGFLGIAADREIAYVTFPEGAFIDDFYYSPEPSAALLLLLAGAGALRRR